MAGSRSSLALVVLALAAVSTGCHDNYVTALAAARAEFHQRWAAKQLYDIYLSGKGDMDKFYKGVGGARWGPVVDIWGRTWRDEGVFQADTEDAGSNEYRDSGSYVHQSFSCRYTRGPAVEQFIWSVRDGKAYLVAFSLAPNTEMRCEGGVFRPKCEQVQLGPVPATPPLGEPVWSLRKDSESMTCEVQRHLSEWDTRVYHNGELESGRRFGTHAEALQYAIALRGTVKQPGWTLVAEVRR